jgi:hemolysin activation/secretion protein
MQPGAQFGLTDVELAVTEAPKDLIQTFVDNQGVASVGKLEAGTLLQHYGMLGLDDRLTLYAVKSAGNIDGNFAYNLAVDPWGGRLGVSFTRGAIHDVSGPYKTLDITGQSQVASVNASQPLFANSDWLFLVNGSFSKQISTSDQTTVPITGDYASLETGGLTLGYTGSSVSATLAPTVTAGQSHSSISGLTEDFTLQSGTLSSLVQLPAGFNATLGGAWQLSNRWLLPGDQLFQVGGPTTVRGYPTSAVAGPDGYYANLELHRAIPIMDTSLDAFAFYDQGAVYNTFPTVQILSSTGLGLAWTLNKYLVAEVSADVPINKVVDPQAPYQLYFRLTAKMF